MLALSAGFCQQEVSPDHFDGNDQRIVKREPVAAAKSKQAPVKKLSSRKGHKRGVAKKSAITLTAKATRH